MVIGIGNEYRRDDGFGPAVVAGLAQLSRHDPGLAAVELVASDGEPAWLLDRWAGAELAIVVDAVKATGPGGRTGPAGRCHVFDAGDLAGSAGERPASSHGVGLGSTVELGRLLDRLPRRLVVVAVTGAEFGYGVGLSPPVAAAVVPVVEQVRRLLS